MATEAANKEVRYPRSLDAQGQHEVILDINNAIMSKFSYEELFNAIATTLRKNFPVDCTAVTIYNEDEDVFEATAIEPFSSDVELYTGYKVPRKDSHMEWVWKNKAPLLRNNIDKVQEFVTDKTFLEQGLKSYIVLPLMSRNDCIGTFNIGSVESDRYHQEDVVFAEVVANLITLAIENVKQYEEIDKLKNQLERENAYLQEEIKVNYNFEEIVTQNEDCIKVLSSIEQVAPTNATVLIIGESGTGKELLARAVHSRSKLSGKPLVKVNCAALPENLIESELFGHEKGAFTGAHATKIGRFELADNGTIFLDEIGELPLALQAKLLRVLQEREFERVGGTQTIKVNIRVIAATNQDLKKAVRKGKFREDLYYRLNVFPIAPCPLRERRGDVPLLVHHFCKKYNGIFGKDISVIPQSVIRKLDAYDWPGNIRELENIIERAVIMSPGKKLEIVDLDLKESKKKFKKGKIQSFQSNQRSHIMAALQQANWKISGPKGAAELLDLNPRTLDSKIKKLGITREDQT